MSLSGRSQRSSRRDSLELESIKRFSDDLSLGSSRSQRSRRDSLESMKRFSDDLESQRTQRRSNFKKKSHRKGRKNHAPPIPEKSAIEGRRRLAIRVLSAVLMVAMVQSLMTSGDVMREVGRRLRMFSLYVIEPTDYVGYWESSFNPNEAKLLSDYVQNNGTAGRLNYTPRPTVAYVVTLSSCPENLIGCHHDPGHAFYEAASVLHHHITMTHWNGSDGQYKRTDFYAIVHPKAQYCMEPDGEYYDRVSLLERLGYNVSMSSPGFVCFLCFDFSWCVNNSTCSSPLTLLDVCRSGSGDRTLAKTPFKTQH